MQPEEKLAANIRPGLVRLSIGLEYVDDLIEDLKQVLNNKFKKDISDGLLR